jgi:hypothetical protein
VLILPPGHARELRIRRRLSVRERWLIGGVLGTLAALVVALAISLGSAGSKSGHGCIYLTLAANAQTGAEEVYHCGGAARSTCDTALRPGAFPRPAALEVARECRKAGLPVGH